MAATRAQRTPTLFTEFCEMSVLVQTRPRQEHSTLPQAAVTTAGTTIEGSQENAGIGSERKNL